MAAFWYKALLCQKGWTIVTFCLLKLALEDLQLQGSIITDLVNKVHLQFNKRATEVRMVIKGGETVMVLLCSVVQLWEREVAGATKDVLTPR